jgi:hypothetical protein
MLISGPRLRRNEKRGSKHKKREKEREIATEKFDPAFLHFTTSLLMCTTKGTQFLHEGGSRQVYKHHHIPPTQSTRKFQALE